MYLRFFFTLYKMTKEKITQAFIILVLALQSYDITLM